MTSGRRPAANRSGSWSSQITSRSDDIFMIAKTSLLHRVVNPISRLRDASGDVRLNGPRSCGRRGGEGRRRVKDGGGVRGYGGVRDDGGVRDPEADTGGRRRGVRVRSS